MSKRGLIGLITAVALATAVSIGGAMYYKSNVVKHPFIDSAYGSKIKVEKGDSLYSVINDMKSKGYLHSAALTKFYVKNNGKGTDIKPGVYTLSEKLTLEDFINNLKTGLYDENTLKVTIPEGYTIDQIASTLEQKGIVKKDDFLKAVKEFDAPAYVKKDKEKKYALEGYLFPETYTFEKGMDSKKIVETMLKQFEIALEGIEKKNGRKLPENEIEKIVNVASVIERETSLESDRGKVASTIYNRIEKKMPLQCDSTVLYAMGRHKEKLMYNDLKVKSPYNTYYVTGLPVGPICSPSKASLEAAMNPEKTNYLYFIIIEDKVHFFTDDYAKFLEAKKKYIGGD